MQFLVVASALVAAVSAEAQFFGYPYAAHVGYGVGLKSAPCVNAANVPVPCAAGYGYAHIGKREAEAEADPALLYAGYAPYAYGVPFGSSTGLDPITQGLDASTQGYAPYAHFGYAHYGKRDAEADPALLYAGYAGYPYASVYGAFPHAVAATTAGLVHSSHVGLCANYLGAAVPC
eukprot:TRINITY_DN706_c0_g1_i11.p2 TRINITY_DN706_c0_g1~~TRINITY_DN706_c0_g1_i11.p2  ORF type:complete len:176 (+),score=46.56 TRINITY_DN706_c0_g1_i11:184-711(+)